MPEEKEGEHKQSFSNLLRGGASTESEPTLHRAQETRKEDRPKRRPILMPMARKEGEEGLFTVTYREWAFLLGALLLLFGGMGLIRMFSPKDLAQPQLAPFSEATPGGELTPEGLDQGSRPPGGGSVEEEVIAPLTARDTTRLVQPPSGMIEEQKKEKPKSPLDSFKDSLWGGAREAEKRTPPRPSLGGLGPSLAGALAGLNAGPPSQGMRQMAPEEIQGRLAKIPTGRSGGREGMPLGYSGGQRMPRAGGGKRVREESSPDRAGKMREAYSGGGAGAEKAVAGAGTPFGEGRAGSGEAVEGGGARVGGETPKSDAGKTELGNYNIQRPQWALEEWKLQNWKKLALTAAAGEAIKTAFTEGTKALIEPLAGLTAGIKKRAENWTSPEEETPPPTKSHSWVARKCPSALQDGALPHQTQVFLDPNSFDPTGKSNVMVLSTKIVKKVTKGEKGSSTEEPVTEPRPCMGPGGKAIKLDEEDVRTVRATGKTRDELLASGPGPQPPGTGTSGAPAETPSATETPAVTEVPAETGYTVPGGRP